MGRSRRHNCRTLLKFPLSGIAILHAAEYVFAVSGRTVRGGIFEEPVSDLGAVLPEAQFRIVTLFLEVDDELFERLLGPSAVEGKVHLQDRELLLEFHQAPIDVLDVTSVQQRPFVEDVGEMAQRDALLSGLVAEHLLGNG